MNATKYGMRGAAGRSGSIRKPAVLLVAAALAGIATTGPAHADPAGRQRTPEARAAHVLLISVDGMHQADLTRYIAAHPNSNLAHLAAQGVQYGNAMTTVPSDSFPGMVAQTTGGHPGTTGVYYDVEYNHSLLPAGTTTCPAGAPTGAPVNFDESLDHDSTSIDAGQGLSGLPGSILSMTGSPQTLINPAGLPVDPNSCKPVYPHSYLKVNTIFEVARAHNLRTAWTDKHPAYEILNGPSGTGIQDLFTPEINSNATGGVVNTGSDWTSDNSLTQQYDSFKVQSIINEIDGFDHSRTKAQGVPAILGMNFQTVSTAQKLPNSTVAPNFTDATPAGGYAADGVTPGPVLAGALNYVDTQLGKMINELAAQGLTNSTTIIVSAKHGQSPMEPSALTRIDDGPLISGLNAAWTAAHPGAPALVAANTDDDAMLIYLNDRSEAAAQFAKNYLLSQTGVSVEGKPYEASGLTKVYAGAEAAKFFGTTLRDGNHPDIYGVVQHGVVYTGKKKKIAEHGGDDPQDRNVPLLISGAGVATPQVNADLVETAQIAPTILALLGLNPNELDAVAIEHTKALTEGLEH